VVTVENSADFGVCPIPIAGLGGVYELRAGTGPPAYLCAMVLGTSRRVKVDPTGSQTVVTPRRPCSASSSTVAEWELSSGTAPTSLSSGLVSLPLVTLLLAAPGLRVYRVMRRSTAGVLRLAGFDLLPAGAPPHFTLRLPGRDFSTLAQVRDLFGPPVPNPLAR